MPKIRISDQPQSNPYADVPDIDDLSIEGPPEAGQKGGQARNDATNLEDKPASMVDFLWQHRND